MQDPIEKLRNCLLCKPGDGQVCYSYESADALADEIEAAYVKLPVAADDVPIRVGDEVENGEFRFKVTDMSWDGHFWHVYHGSIAIAPCDYTHFKPDPVESLLQELANEVWEASCACPSWSESGLDGIAERYAECIREVVEHD